MNELRNQISKIIEEKNDCFSLILDPEKQKFLTSIPNGYIEDFTIPLYEKLSVKSNLKFYKRWFNYSGSLDELIDIFDLKAIEKKRAQVIDYNDYVMIKIAMAFMQNNANIILIEPLHGLHQTTVKKLLKVMSGNASFNKNLCFIFSQISHAMIMTNNAYRYKDESFEFIEVEESQIGDSSPSKAFRLIVKIEDKTVFIKPEEVDYIEAQDGKSYITTHNDSYRSDYTMKELEEKLKPYGFFRCHRSYIINLQKVYEIITWSKNSYSIKLQHEDKDYIPLSRQKVNELNALFDAE